ncbi:hypothetical protein UFOVP130_10 [uncultured Caudovirales phage]|uniref:Uncharacterized protein n=1 Tax=uncultured Caudovirales phage TaxID=2100421 RepID=A0A6J5LC49_9CAUD|nr:hypothetical protein UFOVP130_10 [uncultured Caudovirales phage]
MGDQELINYCVAHCRTEVGAIDRETFSRLHELAGEPEGAIAVIRQRQFWHPDPEWVDRLAAQAMAKAN